MPRSSTAILLFSHRPDREWANKQLVPDDYATSRRVAQVLHTHTQQAIARSGHPVIAVHGDRQRGATFGARLANAFADAFAAGYDRVIAVGSDCPRLHEVDWPAVTAHLANGQPVLGPTPGGGTYLIGLTRAHFHAASFAASFAALPWQSARLAAALDAHLRAVQAPAVCLQYRHDVNTVRDLVALLRAPRPSARALVICLRHALGWQALHIPPASCRMPLVLATTTAVRGPPGGVLA